MQLIVTKQEPIKPLAMNDMIELIFDQDNKEQPAKGLVATILLVFLYAGPSVALKQQQQQ